jgi:hypothetical protein
MDGGFNMMADGEWVDWMVLRQAMDVKVGG